MNLLQKIFSIKNSDNRSHKIFTILGIKFKFNKCDYKNGNLIIFIDKNNKEHIVKKTFFKGLKINLSGDNNVIKIYEPYKFADCVLNIAGCNNLFEFNSTVYEIKNTEFNLSIPVDNRTMIIGKNIYIGENTALLNTVRDGKLLIGEDCMFSANIHIRNDDGHIIRQKGSFERINKGGYVEIGNHVWISRNVFINKNVKIPNNSIIGSCSVVTKTFEEENIILAGNPAKIIKRDIEWQR